MIIDPKYYSMAKVVVEDIQGRAAYGGVSLPALGAIIGMAGPGDHVEIGSLFGASAIMAALVKNELGHEGKVFCIDPFGQRENVTFHEEVKAVKQQEATLDAVLANFEKFKVSDRMVVLPQVSDPFPFDLKDHRFVTAYIDGDHQNGMPWRDFLNLRDKVDRFIMFDNFEEAYPDIVVAGLRALASGGWFLHYKEGIFLSIRRPFVVKDFEKEWEKLRKASAI